MKRLAFIGILSIIYFFLADTSYAANCIPKWDPSTNIIDFCGARVTNISDPQSDSDAATRLFASQQSGGAQVAVDLNDDNNNEADNLNEIAIINDSNSIFTVPVTNKLLIDVSNTWPVAAIANGLSAGAIDNISDIASTLLSGNGSLLATVAGAVTSGCAQWDANGNLTSTGSPCGSGSGSFNSFNINADSGGPTTVGDGQTVSVLGGLKGIDTTISGFSITVSLDSTEINTSTFGDGSLSSFDWTFDVSNGVGGLDPKMTLSDNSITFNTEVTAPSFKSSASSNPQIIFDDSDTSNVGDAVLSANCVDANNCDLTLSTLIGGSLSNILSVDSVQSILTLSAGNIRLSSGGSTLICSSTQTLTTDASGNIVCATDQTGGGGGGLSSFNVADGNSNSSTIDSSNNTLTIKDDNSGVESVLSSNTFTLSFKPSEIDSVVFSDGTLSTIDWTFSLSGTSDPVITFGDAYVDFSTEVRATTFKSDSSTVPQVVFDDSDTDSLGIIDDGVIEVNCTDTSSLSNVDCDFKVSTYVLGAKNDLLLIDADDGSSSSIFSVSTQKYQFSNLDCSSGRQFVTTDSSGLMSCNTDQIQSGTSFPSSPADGEIFVLTAAFAAGSCATGGTSSTICIYDSASNTWSPLGDGAGAGSYSFDVNADGGTKQTITSGETLLIFGDAGGIDTSVGNTDQVTVSLDTTEIETKTFGSNSSASFAWTFDVTNTTGTDPIMTFSDGSVSFSTDTTKLLAANPKFIFDDSDASSTDDVTFDINCTDVTSGSEDCDILLSSYVAGTKSNVFTLDADLSGSSVIILSADQYQLNGLNCSGLGNGGKLTTDASGNIICSGDQTAAGGSGMTSFVISDGSNNATINDANTITYIGDTVKPGVETAVSSTGSNHTVTLALNTTLIESTTFGAGTSNTSIAWTFDIFKSGGGEVDPVITFSDNLVNFNTPIETAPSSTPSISFVDNDTADKDISGLIQVNCSNTGTGAEDCDMTFFAQQNGSVASANDFLMYDSDTGAGVDSLILDASSYVLTGMDCNAAIGTGDKGVLGTDGAGTMTCVPDQIRTSSSFPSSPAAGEIIVITDDSSAGACDSSGGSAISICYYNGSSWVAIGDGGGGGGSSPWQTTANVVNLVTSTDAVTVGSSTNLAKLAVDSDDAGEISFLIQAAASQTANLLVIEDSSGSDLLTVDSNGVLSFADPNAGISITSSIILGVDSFSVPSTGAPSLNTIGSNFPKDVYQYSATADNTLYFEVPLGSNYDSSATFSVDIIWSSDYTTTTDAPCWCVDIQGVAPGESLDPTPGTLTCADGSTYSSVAGSPVTTTITVTPALTAGDILVGRIVRDDDSGDASCTDTDTNDVNTVDLHYVGLNYGILAN